MVGQVGRLAHAQVLEGLGLRVDHLVVVLALHLVGGHGVPPEELVEVVGGGLEDGLGHVDAAAVLDDFPIDELGNLGRGVVLGTVEFEGLADGGVVVQHLLHRTGDVNRLLQG